jgi:hypothetical protein
MRKTAITLTALGLIGALTVASAAPAEAHGWDHRGGREHGWSGHRNSGAAIGLGILGAFAGAAIAASHPYPYYGTPYGYAGYGYYR